jgi:acyl carrier protein
MVTIDEVKEQIKEVLARQFPQVAGSLHTFDEQAPLLSASLQLDSIDLLLLVLEIEKKFGIRLVAGEFDESIWANLNSLAQAIRSRMLKS